MIIFIKSDIEKYPNIIKILCDHWNDPNIMYYLDSLIYNRDSNNIGFPIAVIKDLFMLMNILKFNFSKKRGIWGF